MADFRTSKCGRADQQEITLHLSDGAHMDPQWLLDFFEESVIGGKRFRPHETVQIGWMIVKLIPNPQGDLEIWEPDFRSVPIRWVRGVNETIRHLTLQKSVAELFQLEPTFPSLLQAGIVAPSFLEAHNQFFMNRGDFAQNDSGWKFMAQESDSFDGQFQSLFEIACHKPLIVPFLALPSETTVTYSSEIIVVKCNEIRISSGNTELLRRIAEAAQ